MPSRTSFKPPASLRRWLFVALALSAGACADQSATTPRTVVNHCQSDADCAEGRCDRALLRCVATTRTEVFFSATPPGGRLSATAYPTISQLRTLHSGDTVDLALRAPHTVYGVVARPDPSQPTNPGLPPNLGLSQPLQATVEFVSASLAGLVEPVPVATAPSALARDPQGFTYSVTITDGSYDVAVRPASSLASQVPPYFLRAFDVRADSPQQRLDILYPADFVTWSGTLTDRTGRALPGLTVRCIDPTRGGALVSTVASTTPTTSGSAGGFEVRLSPGAPDDWTLRVSTSASARGWLTVDLPRAALARLGDRGRDLRLELPAIPGLPDAEGRCTGCITVRGTVEGQGLDGRSRPIVGASVTFRSAEALGGMPEGARAWYQASVQTDSEGGFVADLAPSDYDVVVVPQSQEFANALHRGFRVTAREGQREQVGQIFEVPPRLPVTGRVLTPQGDPARQARVTAIPFSSAYVSHQCLEDQDMRALAPLAGTVTTTTTADGSYRLDLDPGLYRFLVDPGTNSGFAPTLHQALCITGAGLVDVLLDTPVEVHGVVRDAVGRSLPGAAVEGLIRVREPGAPGVLVRAARATANARGEYSLLLPGGAAVEP